MNGLVTYLSRTSILHIFHGHSMQKNSNYWKETTSDEKREINILIVVDYGKYYPPSDDIISIDTWLISFLTYRLTVFSRAVKHLWFSVVLSFRSFCVNLFARFVDHRWGTDRIRRRKRKSEYKEEDNKLWLAWFNISSWAFTTSCDDHLSKFIF